MAIIAKATNDTDPLNSPNHNTQHGYMADALNFGWIPVDGTFTYASATTINISAGGASVYTKGDKLRFQNNNSGTYLYAYIITVADTLLTVVGDAVPNATLTDQEFSKILNPQGFPQFFAWTPTYTASSGTPTTVTTTTARYSMIGKQVTLVMKFTITDKGTAAASLIYTTPITAAQVASGGGGYESAGTGTQLVTWLQDTTHGYLAFYNAGTPWQNGHVHQITLVYEAA